MNIFDSGVVVVPMVGGLGTSLVTNFRGELNHLVIDAPSDTITYFVEIINTNGKTIWIDESTGDHTFKINMTIGINFTIRVRNASEAGDFSYEFSGDQGTK